MREPAFRGKTEEKWVIVRENKTDVCEYREQGWEKKRLEESEKHNKDAENGI